MNPKQALVVSVWFAGILMYIGLVMYSSVQLGHAFGPLSFLATYVVAILLAELVVHKFFVVEEE